MICIFMSIYIFIHTQIPILLLRKQVQRNYGPSQFNDGSTYKFQLS